MAADAPGVWSVDDITRFQRFLCIGSEKPLYKTQDTEPTREDLVAMKRLIHAGKGSTVIQVILDHCKNGRLVKIQPAIFALATCVKDSDIADVEVKQLAYKVLQDVCQIPTHLFLFVFYCHKIVRECKEGGSKIGWGRSSRRAVSQWYNSKDPMVLARLVTKYIQRHSWSHRDILRSTHVKPENTATALVLCYATNGFKELRKKYGPQQDKLSIEEKAVLDYLSAVTKLKKCKEEEKAGILIEEHKFAIEQVPTWLYNSKQVWTALLQHMPICALIRNLGKMSNVGVFEDDPEQLRNVVDKLHDEQVIRNSKVHPFQFLTAYHTYKSGKGVKGKLTWKTEASLVDALLDAFYASFKAVPATGCRLLLAIDVSGSMSFSSVSDCYNIPPLYAAAAMATVMHRSETPHSPQVVVMTSCGLKQVQIPSDSQAVSSVLNDLTRFKEDDFDVADPIKWATEQELEFDAFIMFTDCHTFPNRESPASTLKQYREKSKIKHAKLIVVAMKDNDLSLADPDDAGMLDIAGFDANVPQLIHNFVTGQI